VQTVLISGAGIAGPALAHWLLRYGFTPTLIERAPHFRDGGYMIDIWGTGYDILERFGSRAEAERRGYHFDRLAFVDEDGRELAGFGGKVFRRALKDRFFSSPRGDLARLLYETVEGKVETQFGTAIADHRENADGVDVTFTTGETRRFDLVVGAEGLRSRLRERVFGPEKKFEKYLGYCAASFIVDGYPHRDEGTYLSYAKPGRQISRYAMREGRTAFLLVFARQARPTVHDADAQKALLHQMFGRDGWETPEILPLLDKAGDLYFDAVSQIRMPSWSKGRVVLLGDTAYCPSLLAGAGSHFAMLGAYVLAGELKRAGGDHARAFAEYEKTLRAYLTGQQNMAVGFAGSFTPKTAFGIAFRNFMLKLMGIPFFGEWMVRRMLGEPFAIPDYPAA